MRVKAEKGQKDFNILEFGSRDISHDGFTSSEQYKRELIATKIRTENRERKKRWRKLNAERNKDNDLRCRLNKRAAKLFGKQESEAKKIWLQEEFKKRQAKRYEKERRRDSIIKPGNEHLSGTEGTKATSTNEITEVSDLKRVNSETNVVAVNHVLRSPKAVIPLESFKQVNPLPTNENNRVGNEVINVADDNESDEIGKGDETKNESEINKNSIGDEFLGEAMASAAALTSLFNSLNAINDLATVSLKSLGVEFPTSTNGNTGVSTFTQIPYQTEQHFTNISISTENDIDQNLLEADYPMEAVMTLMHLGGAGTNSGNTTPQGGVDDDGHRSITPKRRDSHWNLAHKRDGDYGRHWNEGDSDRAFPYSDDEDYENEESDDS